MNKEIDTSSENEIILIIFGFIAFIFFIVTSLPAFIFSVIMSIGFININIRIKSRIRISKFIISFVGLFLGVIVNTKFYSFQNYYLSPAVRVIKSILYDIIHKNINAIPGICKDYMWHINILWQLIIALIISGIISGAYELSNRKVDITNLDNDKKANRTLEKLKDQEHKENLTVIGAEYENGKVAEIEDKAKHVLIAGTTGAGKTVTISNFIQSAMQKQYPILAIDGKGDLQKGSLLQYMQEISNKYNRKLYVINFFDSKYSDSYNPFRNAGRTEAKDMLISMNEWTEPYYKINTERYLQQLIKMLLLAGIPLDLNTIIKYSPEQFKALIKQMRDTYAIQIEEYTKISEIIEITASIVNSAMARFATTAESEAGEIFNSGGIDIYTALKEKSNILIILDSLGKPELSKQVGRLAILDAKKAVSKLFGDATRKFFILDEFNVYASDVAVDLLNKSRSANVTCIPAVQSLSDLDKAGGADLRNQVIENCNNYIIMRQNSPASSEIWEKIIGQKETYKYTYSMKESNGLFKNKNINTGTGSMYKTTESIFTASKIQELNTGQGIFISKDQSIVEKIKIRYVDINEMNPVLKANETKECIKEAEDLKKEIDEKIVKKVSNKNVEQNEQFDDVEDILNSK